LASAVPASSTVQLTKSFAANHADSETVKRITTQIAKPNIVSCFYVLGWCAAQRESMATMK
jgi:hypothetical protein